MFRRPEPVYDDIGRHPFPSRSVIDTFPVELKDYYLRVLQHLETGCDLEPASEAVIRLHSEQQQSTVDGSTDPNICDSETKSVEGVDSKSSARSSSIPPASLSKMSIKKGKTLPRLSRREAARWREWTLALDIYEAALAVQREATRDKARTQGRRRSTGRRRRR